MVTKAVGRPILRGLMIRLCLAVLGLTLALRPVFPQEIDPGDAEYSGLDREESTLSRFSHGFASGFSAWDLSIAFVGLLSALDSFYSEHHLDFPVLGFDVEFTDWVARTDGNTSLGTRIDPNRLSWAIIASQFAATAILDEFTEAGITRTDYLRIHYFAKANILNAFVTDLSKSTIYRERPNGFDGRSFFSGHTSDTFVLCSFLYREAEEWMDACLPGSERRLGRSVAKIGAFGAFYGWAAYVGFSRIYDRGHYLSDVIVGAAVGTTIGNFMYSRFQAKVRDKGSDSENPELLLAGTSLVLYVPL